MTELDKQPKPATPPAYTGPSLKECEQMVKDNWQHRSSNMTCSTCMWFVEKNPKIGRCRKHCPTLDGFPALFPGDWCGDHKIDETKLE